MAALHRLSGREARTTPGTLPWGDATPATAGQFGQPAAGVSVTEQSTMGVAAVYACVGLLADGIATLPLRQYRGDPLQVKAAVPMDPSPLLLQPCSEGTLTDFLTGGQMSLALRGNAFGWIIDRDRRGYATQILDLDPSAVSVRRGADGQLEYRVQGEKNPLPNDDVFHIRNLKRAGSPVGLNPIEMLRTTWGLALGSMRYAASFFQNSALPLGVLTSEEDLTPEAVLDVLNQWKQMHQGIANASNPAVLSGGIEWHQISMNMEDLQFIESQQMSTAQVAMIFRVPPHMISQVDRTTSWGSGVEQQFLGFVRFTLGGYLSRWERAFSVLLPRGQFAKFDLRALLRPDSVQRAAVGVALRNAGVLSANEYRDIYEDMGPIPDLPNPGKGDVWLQPMNMGEAGVPPVVSTPSGSKSAGEFGYESRESLLAAGGLLREIIAGLPPR